MSPIVVLAGVGAVAISAAVTLTVLVIGIRRGDRCHLASEAQSNPDAFARHLLLGVRCPASLSESPDNEMGAVE